MFKPRPYQVSAIDTCIDIMTVSKKMRKELVVQPTAAGKSWLTATTVDSLDVPVVILQPSGELLKQNYDKFIKLGGKATINSKSLKVKQKDNKFYTEIGGKFVRCDEVSKVTYATIGSVMKDIAYFKKIGLKHLIIDEAHLMTKSGSQIRQFITTLKIKNVLGLTATPVYLANAMEGATLKMINRVRGKLFSKISHVTQIQELVRDNYWSKLIYKVEDTDIDYLRYNSNGSDYTDTSQTDYYEENNLKEKVLKELDVMIKAGRKSILVFVPTIKAANDLFRDFPNSAVVHSKVDAKTRAYVVEAFKRLDIPVVFNVNVLATGFDHPELDSIITARATASIAIYYQQLGRLVRIHENKKEGLVVDFSGNVNNFGKIEYLTFEDLPNYGWGMFGEGGILLTGFPISITPKPTKKSLQQKYIEDTGKRNNELLKDIGNDGSVKFWFGKHKDSTVIKAIEKDKQYILWMYGNFDFNSDRMKQLKKHIEIQLKLPITVNII